MIIGIDIRNIGKRRTGDEVVFRELVRALAELDRENEYRLFIDARTETEMTSVADRLGIVGRENFRMVPVLTKNRFDWNAWRIAAAIRRERIDVYHTQYIVPMFIPRRTKVVTHIHDVSFRAYPRFIAFSDRLFLSLYIPPSLRRADRVVAVSAFTKRELVARYELPKTKIVVVPNAVAPEFLMQRKSGNIRKKYDLPEKYILSLGTLQPRKNIPTLIEAFDRISEREEMRGCMLALAGNREGHHYDHRIDEAIDHAKHHDRIRFLGYVDDEDVPDLMEGASVFAFPSYYEGFGVPALEAMSQNVPVVLSDIPVFREIAGDAALFARPDEVASFAESLYTACTSSMVRERLVVAGRSRLRHFSWEKSARAVLAVYRDLVG